jgi:hypothetical protein
MSMTQEDYWFLLLEEFREIEVLWSFQNRKNLLDPNIVLEIDTLLRTILALINDADTPQKRRNCWLKLLDVSYQIHQVDLALNYL